MKDNLSLSRRVVKGILWTSSSVAFIYLVRIVTLMALARLLTPEDFGTMAAAMLVVSFSDIFVRLGIGSALVQRPILESIHIRAGFTLSLFLGGIFAIMLWVVAPIMVNLFRIESILTVLRVLSLTFFLKALSIVPRALLQREMRFRTLATIESLSYMVGYAGVGIPLAILGFGVWSLVGAHFAEVTISSLGALLLRPHDFRPVIDKHAMRQLLSFGIGHTIARIANYVSTQADKFIVGRWLGVYQLGIYSRAYYFIGTASAIVEAVVGRVLFVAMAQLQHDRERLASAYLRSISLISGILCPVAAVSIVIAPELIKVLLGEQWNEVVNPFRILAVGMLFGALCEISNYLVMAKGAVYLLGWMQMLYAAAVIVGAWLGLLWGVSGVASGVIVAMMMSTLVVITVCLRLTGLVWHVILPAFAPAVISGSVLGLWAWVIYRILKQFSLPSILILSVTGLTCLFMWPLLWRISPRIFLGSIGREAVCALFNTVPKWVQSVWTFIIGHKLIRGCNPSGGNSGCPK